MDVEFEKRADLVFAAACLLASVTFIVRHGTVWTLLWGAIAALAI